MTNPVQNTELFAADINQKALEIAESLAEILRVKNEIIKTKPISVFKSSDGKEAKSTNAAINDIRNNTQKLNKVEAERIRLTNKLTQLNSEKQQQNTILKEQIIEQNRVNKQLAREKLGLVSVYEKESRKLNELRKKYKDAALTQGENSKAARRFRKEATKLDQKLKRIDASVGQFQRNVGNYAKALGGLSRILGAAGLTLGIAGLFRVLRNGINILRDFEKSSAELAGVFDTTREGVKMLTDDAVRLGSTTAKTAQEITDLQIAYARLGFSQSEIIDLTEDTINGSIAMNAQLGETAELTGAVVNSFDDLSTTDAGLILDQMVASTQQSALNFEKLKTALPIVSSAANESGVSFDKLLAILGKLSDAGIDTSTSATALRNIFLEAGSQGLSYEEILKKIANSTNKLTASNDEFGKRAAVSSTVIAKNLDEIDNLNEGIQKAGGTAERVAETQLNTLDGAITLLGSAWEGYILQLNEGEGITGTLTGVIGFLAENLSTILNVLGRLIIAFGVFKATQLAVLNAQKLYTFALRVGVFFKNAYAKATGKATAATKKFNNAMRANVIGAIITVITTLILLIDEFADGADKAATKQELLNDAQAQAQKSIAKERAELDKLIAIAKDETQSKENREAAIKRLNEISPEYLGNLNLENIATEEGTKMINNYVDALEKKAIAQAFNSKLEDLYKKKIDEQNSSLEDNLGFWDYLGSAFHVNKMKYFYDEANENRSESISLIDQEIANLKELQAQMIKEGKIAVDTAETVGGSYNKNAKVTVGILNVLNAQIKELNKQKLEALSVDKMIEINREILKLKDRLESINDLVDKSIFSPKQAQKLKLDVDTSDLDNIDNIFDQLLSIQSIDDQNLDEIDKAFNDLTDRILDNYKDTEVKFKVAGEDLNIFEQLLSLTPEDKAKLQEELGNILSSLKTTFSKISEIRLSAIEEEISKRDEAIGELESQLAEEQELQRTGAASRLSTVKRELAEEQRARDLATKEREKTVRLQQRLDDAQQLSSIITAAANLIKNWSTYPAPFGQILGATAVATLLAGFVATKIQAAQVVKAEKGVAWLQQGKRHSQGGEDFKVNMEAGEVGVVYSRPTVKRIGAQNLISMSDGLNAGLSPDEVLTGVGSGVFYVDTNKLERGVDDISGYLRGQPRKISDKSTFYPKSRTTITNV